VGIVIHTQVTCVTNLYK